jgi:hypothetical protein
MKIEVLNRNLPSTPHTTQRIRELAGRMVQRVSRNVREITVKVEALASRGSADSREVVVLMSLSGGGQVVVRKRGESVIDLVLLALRQARNTALKTLSRRRDRAGTAAPPGFGGGG